MKKLFPIRLSHLLRHCSVGAIVRGPDSLITVKDTGYWKDRNGRDAGRPLLYVDRVRSALNIQQELREPPISKELQDGIVDGTWIPAKLFPSWGICPSCGLLHFMPPLFGNEGPPRCQETDRRKCLYRPKIDQVQYVIVHREGYMDDVPWHYLTHTNSNEQRPTICRNDNDTHYLRLQPYKNNRFKSELVCEKCKARNIFQPLELKAMIRHMRKQPWVYESVEIEDAPEIVKVNEIQIHFPICQNALVIPPESRIRKGTIVDRLYNNTEKRRLMDSSKSDLQRRSLLRRFAGEFRCEIKEVKEAWSQIKKGYPLFGKELNFTPGQLREDEYKALIKVIPDVSDDEDFVTLHHSREWVEMSNELDKMSLEGQISRAIDRLIAVNRLKEILVFEGFTRVDSPDQNDFVVKPDLVGVKKWLPAIELFGEGIFLTIEPSCLEKWEIFPKVVERSEAVQKRYEKSKQLHKNILNKVTPRFLLLHTLAHLLIRQLENDGGYPAASIKERIYCSEGEVPMAGILIYVAVPDVVGSLGGIMELAEPRRFLSLASAAIARSQWCSLDPVCSEHEGQGIDLLNRAACHACLLIPEPSCDYKNALLDRNFIKGDRKIGLPPFFQTSNITKD